MTYLSRREFTALAVAGGVAAPFAFDRHTFTQSITANDIIERIKKNIGVEWKADTVDTVKAGAPSTVIRGVVTTSMATLDVLQKAVNAGANFVITAQPTFYSRAERNTPPPDGCAAGCRRAAAAAPAPPAPRIAGSDLHGQERVHRQTQPRRLSPERPLAGAHTRSARAGHRDVARLDQISVRRRSAPFRSARPHARRARRHT